MEQFFVGVGASLTAALLAGALGYLLRGNRFKQRVESAPGRYVERLDELLRRAIKEGRRNALVNARAIICVRDDLRDNMISLAGLLNGEIDQLARELEVATQADFVMMAGINEYIQRRDSDREPAPIQTTSRNDVLFETIEVLWRKWPTKRDQMEVEIRKLLAELGLDRA